MRISRASELLLTAIAIAGVVTVVVRVHYIQLQGQMGQNCVCCATSPPMCGSCTFVNGNPSCPSGGSVTQISMCNACSGGSGGGACGSTPVCPVPSTTQGTPCGATCCDTSQGGATGGPVRCGAGLSCNINGFCSVLGSPCFGDGGACSVDADCCGGLNCTAGTCGFVASSSVPSSSAQSSSISAGSSSSPPASSSGGSSSAQSSSTSSFCNLATPYPNCSGGAGGAVYPVGHACPVDCATINVAACTITMGQNTCQPGLSCVSGTCQANSSSAASSSIAQCRIDGDCSKPPPTCANAVGHASSGTCTGATPDSCISAGQCFYRDLFCQADQKCGVKLVVCPCPSSSSNSSSGGGSSGGGSSGGGSSGGGSSGGGSSGGGSGGGGC